MDASLSQRIKELSVDILIDFDRFCREHNLRYNLSFGTLLGAVRHKGFIPWDDDVDVDMPLEDYLRFTKLWLKYGDKEKYFFQSKQTDPKVPVLFNRLRLNGTTWSDPEHESFPIHWGIPIDIFPIYHCPKNALMKKVLQKLIGLSGQHCSYDWYHQNAKPFVSWIHWVMSLFYLQGAYMISYFSKSSPLIYNPSAYANRKIGKLAWLYPTKPGNFEGVELQIPVESHAYLVWQYGEDYMTPPPEDQRGGHAIGLIDLEHDGEFYTHCLRRNK